jgi:hypothetical protein
MPLPALLLPLLAAAVPAPVQPSTPITVTGHAWAPFISPAGEPFRAHSPTDDTLADWFANADRNHDGQLTGDEMQADAERFFATLDSDHDGEIDPDELANYEYEIAPDIQVMSRTRPAPGDAKVAQRHDDGSSHHRRRAGDDIDDSALAIGGGLQGAARYGLLNLPEPVAAADTDFDRAITLNEFRQAALARFQLLDKGRSSSLTLAQLEALRPVTPAGRRPKSVKNAADTRVGNPLPAGN